MYHQFKELAGVDITKEAMEVGPTCHYLNGGLRVEADSTATKVAGLFAAGEVAGGLHGANRLGGNSLSDLVVFGRRAGALRRRVRPVAQERRSAGRRPGRDGHSHLARPLRQQGPRKPLRHPRGPAGVHADPGGDHPHRG
jgi:succinate dehydrogenase / fumarate reductase flavoprotein subunit